MADEVTEVPLLEGVVVVELRLNRRRSERQSRLASIGGEGATAAAVGEPSRTPGWSVPSAPRLPTPTVVGMYPERWVPGAGG
jgi:hypothetical protein